MRRLLAIPLLCALAGCRDGEPGPVLGTTEWDLSNGLKIILKPTDFKNDEILLGASRFGGQSLFGQADMYNAALASMVVQAMGLAEFAPTDLQKTLAGKVATVSSASAGIGLLNNSSASA